MRHQSTFVASLLLCIVAADSACSSTFDWTNTLGGTYSTAANWTPAGGPPGSGDIARLTLPGTYAINFTTSPSINTLTQIQGDVTLNLNNLTFTSTNTANNAMGSAGLTSTLRVNSGNFRPNNFSIASVANSTSNLYLDAGAVARSVGGPFYVGTAGIGNISLQSGATLLTSAGAGLGINTGAVGTATVAGQDSAWTVNTLPLRVGSSGTGTLNILGGGAVTAFGLEVGENLASIGTLSLSGNGAAFSTTGTANIGGSSAGAPAASATLNIGTGSTVSLTGTTNLRTNSKVNVTGGTLNLKTLNITNGAAVNWSAGTVNFDTAPTITTNILNTFLAGTHTLGSNRTLSATTGTFTLATPLDLTGGTIAVPTLVIGANMDIGAFSAVSATNTVTLQTGATVKLRDFATLGATTSVTNNGGTLLLDGPLTAVTGPTTNTAGVIRGTGRFTAGLNNAATGTIRAEAGDHLIIDTVAPTNAGTIALSGGTIEYSQALTNQATGTISGRGVFQGSSAAPGGTGLNNDGVLSFSAGITDIYGDVNNNAGAKIVAAGASTVTFFDDVVSNGDIKTVTGSRSVFFGAYSGSGTLSGGGTFEFEGDLKPGNSPANISVGGDVIISSTAGLSIELGGTLKGSQFDAITIAGSASISGTFNASLINGFVPSPGQSFEILTAAHGIDGTFDTVSLPGLGNGLYLNLAYAPNAITLSVAGTLGDFSHNNVVDAADYVLWRRTQANSPTGYDTWRSHFDSTPGGPGAFQDTAVSSTVPEPASLVLLLFSATVGMLLRPRNRRAL